jgi:hypothetical protein
VRSGAASASRRASVQACRQPGAESARAARAYQRPGAGVGAARCGATSGVRLLECDRRQSWLRPRRPSRCRRQPWASRSSWERHEPPPWARRVAAAVAVAMDGPFRAAERAATEWRVRAHRARAAAEPSTASAAAERARASTADLAGDYHRVKEPTDRAASSVVSPTAAVEHVNLVAAAHSPPLAPEISSRRGRRRCQGPNPPYRCSSLFRFLL